MKNRSVYPRIASVGVWFDRRLAESMWKHGLNAFGIYVEEVLAHAGLPFRYIRELGELETGGCDILIAALAAEDEPTAEALWSFAERGGTVVAFAGLNRMAKRLGCEATEPFGPGYAELSGIGEYPRLRYLRVQPWIPRVVGVHPADGRGILRDRSPDGTVIGSALQRFAVGAGAIERWSVDVPFTIVGLQQGSGPVLSDGLPCPDGTADIDEGILKADDRCAMDWRNDRAATATGQRYFARPYADYWREALVSRLLGAALRQGLTLPFVGYWPEGVEQVAMISFDSDLNVDESALTTLDVLRECGIRTTWCMLEPGFAPDLSRRIAEAGHELALHYNALEADGGSWGEREFVRQAEWLDGWSGGVRVVSNKNHYTRFEGWGELFRWCESRGIASDQTRGPSKKGNVGFLFGTCHPYFPVAWADERNRPYDVLEIGFLTQDLDHPRLADSSVIVPFLEETAKVRGVAHFLFHQIHIHRLDSVRAALRAVVREAKGRGFAFWTGQQINDWERYRRKLRIAGFDGSGGAILEGRAAGPAPTVWVPVSEGDASAEGADVRTRFGVRCRQAKLSE